MTKKEKEEEPEPVACEGKIYFQAIEARDLKGGKKLAPFCKVFLDKEKKFTSEVMSKTKDPTWDEKARLIVLSEEVPSVKVTFKIMHKGSLMTDYVGELSFLISDLLDGVPRDDWFVLKNKKGTKDVGELHLQVMYLKVDEDITEDKDEFAYPLQCLLRKGNLDSWSNLIATDPDFDKPDKNGRTALHVTSELDQVDQMKVLLDKKADISIEDSDGRTALHAAAIHGSEKALTCLLEKKPKVNAKDSNGQTPLHLAAINNHSKVIETLLENEADVSAVDNDGNTPLHVALMEGSKEAMEILIAKGADIYKKNNKDLCPCLLSVEVGKDKEAVKDAFFRNINVVDSREFTLKQKHKHRVSVGGKGLVGEDNWQSLNPQYAIKAPKGAEIHLLMHYDDPISKTTQPMEKCSFITFRALKGAHKQLSYWHDNVAYGRVEPVTINFIDEENDFVTLVYSKSLTKLSGAWNIIGYSDTEFSIEELESWPHKQTLENKWEGDSAGGCIEHASFANNPKFTFELPPETVKFSLSLGQQKNMGDVEPFSIIPYKYHIGLYIFEKDVTNPIDRDPIVRTNKFKNSRENNVTFELDGSKYEKVVVIPATFKPTETSTFTLIVASSHEVKIEELAELPKAPSSSPKKKRKKKKKSTA